MLARQLLRERRLDEASALLEAAFASRADSAEIAFLAGTVRAERNDFRGAVAALERAFALQPAQPAAHHLVFAFALADAGDFARAESLARRTLELQPRWPRALDALAAALRGLGRTDEAIEAMRAAAELDPSQGVRWWRVARLLHRQARLTEAIPAYRDSLRLDAANAEAWNDLGNALTDAGRLDEAREAYRRTLALRPGYHQVESNLLINLHYDPAVDAAALYQAHRDWAKRHAAALPRLAPAPRKGGERLRVGFLSPAFTPGPTAAFAAPVVGHLDRRRFELVAYNVGATAGIDPAIRGAFGAWHDAAAEDDEALARRIAADGLDVLVDLAGHAPGGRLRTLAMKPAPVIVTWLDYFDTTGLDQVDYIVGDPVSTPEGTPQRFSEAVLHLAPCRFCYAPPAYAPAVAPPPAARAGFVTFGSFNRLSKLAPPVLDLWARAVKAVPGSRLLVKNAAFSDPGTREGFAAALAARGVDPARLDLRGPSPHAAMLAEYGEVDIALDCFPYNGGLTTCEALWMGVPVVALQGEAMISRQSASMLRAAGLADLVALDAARFVERAASLASDVAALAALRARLRDRLAASPLLDAPRFAAAFGALLERAAARAPAAIVQP